MSVAGVRKNAQYVLDKLSSDTKLQVFFLELGRGGGVYLKGTVE